MANESTRLLTDTEEPASSSPPATSSANADSSTPLPKTQILLLSLTRIAEPLCFAILFPFVNSMVLSTGNIKVEEVGYYVGLIESLFSATQMVFLIGWGYAADKCGRKPVLLVSLLGLVVSTILFGFSTSLWQMMAARCISGVFGGNAVVVRTLFSEFSDSTNQARAFSFFAFASNVGLFLGPVIGGAFAEPSRQFPDSVGRLPLFIKYPYSLPCIIAGLYVMVPFFLCLFFLEEPVHREKAEKQPLRKLFNVTLVKVMIVYSMAMLLGIAYTALIPLFAFTPVPLGGLSFTPSQIALFIALTGLSQSLWLLVIMPPLDKKMGTRRLLHICFTLWPWLFTLAPVENILAKKNQWGAVYGLMAFGSVVGSGVSIAFTSVQLLLNSVTPPSSLGTVNGFALTLNALIRTVTPGAMTAIFAVGVEKNVLWRYLAWAVLFAMGIVAWGLSFLVPSETGGDNPVLAREG